MVLWGSWGKDRRPRLRVARMERDDVDEVRLLLELKVLLIV